MKESDTNIDKQSLSLEDLLSGLKPNGKYEHLQLILSKNNNRKFGQEYLVVSPLGFGVYQLLDIDYQEGRIMMTFRNTETDIVVEERLDINDRSKKFFLVCWADIKRMVYNDKASDHGKEDDLLEFCF
jgi:hypothetical protein